MTNQNDPTLQKLLETLAPEQHIGILLAAQMGGTPQEVQLIIQTGEMDENHESMRTTGQYIVRCIGVREHHLSVGLFANMVLSDSNPLLFNHNEKLMQVHFEGVPPHVDALMIDLNQLYGQTYGIFDPFRRMAMEINPTQPLATILNSGKEVLGVMPQPFAEKVAKVLRERHGMTALLVEHEDDHRPALKFRSLVMDDSYFIAQDFSADPVRS